MCKWKEGLWCTKAELSDQADSETPWKAPPCRICIYIDLDVHKRTTSYWVKDGSGRFTPKVRFPQRVSTWTAGSKHFRSFGRRRWKPRFLPDRSTITCGHMLQR